MYPWISILKELFPFFGTKYIKTVRLKGSQSTYHPSGWMYLQRPAGPAGDLLSSDRTQTQQVTGKHSFSTSDRALSWWTTCLAVLHPGTH